MIGSMFFNEIPSSKKGPDLAYLLIFSLARAGEKEELLKKLDKEATEKFSFLPKKISDSRVEILLLVKNGQVLHQPSLQALSFFSLMTKKLGWKVELRGGAIHVVPA